MVLVWQWGEHQDERLLGTREEEEELLSRLETTSRSSFIPKQMSRVHRFGRSSSLEQKRLEREAALHLGRRVVEELAAAGAKVDGHAEGDTL